MLVGQTLSVIPRSASLVHEHRVLDRAHTVVEPRDRQAQGVADALRPLPFAGVDRAAKAGIGRDRERLGKLDGRHALVAGEAEADDVGMRALGRMARHPDCLLGAEVPTADTTIRASMP